MIRRLKRAGLVVHEPYRGARLTPAGERAALPALRRHRLVEVFLVNVMRFGWEEVHDLADVLQRGIDDRLEARIDELTGHPTRCPHGEPIPTRDGAMPTLNDVSLVTLEPGMSARISRVRTHDPDKLRYLADLGLLPDAILRLEARAPFGGVLRLRMGETEHLLGHELAALLWVEPLTSSPLL